MIVRIAPDRVRPLLAALALVMGAAGPASADAPCPDLSFETDWLNAFFCAQLRDLASDPPDAPTRNVEIPDGATEALIADVPLIQDAYNSDPRRTLELIERIRSAGGATTAR
jgi:hypothetical protein